jgi:hypothetical protein
MTTETSLFTTLYGTKFMDKLSNRDAHLVSCLQQDLLNQSGKADGVNISTFKTSNGPYLSVAITVPSNTPDDDIQAVFYPLTSSMVQEDTINVGTYKKTYGPNFTHYGWDTMIDDVHITIVVIHAI